MPSDPDGHMFLSAPIIDDQDDRLAQDLVKCLQRGTVEDIAFVIHTQLGDAFNATFPTIVIDVGWRSHPRWKHDRIEVELMCAGKAIIKHGDDMLVN